MICQTPAARCGAKWMKAMSEIKQSEVTAGTPSPERVGSATMWRVYYNAPISGRKYLWCKDGTVKWMEDKLDGKVWNAEDAQTISRAVNLLTEYDTGIERVFE